jgi:hypothetical protein
VLLEIVEEHSEQSEEEEFDLEFSANFLAPPPLNVTYR